MGSALHSYTNGRRGTKLSDGKGVGGTGRLTDAVVDRMQTYYGYAIRNNKGNTTKITNGRYITICWQDRLMNCRISTQILP